MEWINAISQLIGHIAWPVTIITLLIMFRHEVRQRLISVTEVKYPGGSITMREVERLEASVEEVTATSLARKLTTATTTNFLESVHSDSRLAIAQMRLDAERELFLLSRHALSRADVSGWAVGRYIEELEKAQVIDPPFADNIQAFVSLANKIVHQLTLPEEIVQRTSAIGSALVAALRHKRLVLEAKRNFDGHGIWHMHRHIDEASQKYYFWSAVAASLPDFDYDYDIYLEALECHNKKTRQAGHESHLIYVLSLEEFVSVLEFRESELLRIIDLWRSGHGWDKNDEAIRWQWPSEWGDLGWSGDILHERVHLWGAEEDLMRTRAALSHYRIRLLDLRRRASV